MVIGFAPSYWLFAYVALCYAFVGNFICLSFLLFALEDGLKSFAMVGFLDSMAQQEMLQAYVIRSKDLLGLDILVVL
jgi:hypothetical protein